MARVVFTDNLERHVACPPCQQHGTTVREVLEGVFRDNRRARGYVLDERGALRKHMVVFVNGEPIQDRQRLTDAVGAQDEVYIMQALSGG